MYMHIRCILSWIEIKQNGFFFLWVSLSELVELSCPGLYKKKSFMDLTYFFLFFFCYSHTIHRTTQKRARFNCFMDLNCVEKFLYMRIIIICMLARFLHLPHPLHHHVTDNWLETPFASSPSWEYIYFIQFFSLAFMPNVLKNGTRRKVCWHDSCMSACIPHLTLMLLHCWNFLKDFFVICLVFLRALKKLKRESNFLELELK